MAVDDQEWRGAEIQLSSRSFNLSPTRRVCHVQTRTLRKQSEKDHVPNALRCYDHLSLKISQFLLSDASLQDLLIPSSRETAA